MREEVNTKSIKKDVDISQTGIRKRECPFRLQGKPIKGGQGWMVELICVPTIMIWQRHWWVICMLEA